jgi:hypothetical protein
LSCGGLDTTELTDRRLVPPLDWVKWCVHASRPIDDFKFGGKRNVGLFNSEEIRRLTAYVAHLRDETDRFRQPQPPLTQRPLPNSAGAIVGFTVMVGVASVLRIIARRLPRLLGWKIMLSKKTAAQAAATN